VDLYSLFAADNMQIRLTDKQIADAITSLERQSLRDKMAHWGDELKKRLSVYLEEGINQMVGYSSAIIYLTN
jgi:signal transduction histidine kinase